MLQSKPPNHMRLREIVLRHFRPYIDEVRISIDDFTAFVGKNDIGKSCILEALEIFFNSGLVKLDRDDLTRGAPDDSVTIGCVFDDLPDELVLDAQARTTLAQERLLNSGGRLEILKVFDCHAGKVKKEAVFAKADHPSAPEVAGLLQMKVADLRAKVNALGIDRDAVDMRSNPDMRRAIWAHVQDLDVRTTLIPLDEQDAKRIWEQLQKRLPIFALFQADRPSRDEDSEFQDPMKVAIREALAAEAAALDAVKEAVRNTALGVATRTLEKLREIDPTLATTLTPNFRTDPKWDSIFKLSLEGDDGIPMNKRGSGVRRLILMNFFRAEAERRLAESESSDGIIYAIEEPETSQHPAFQKLLVEALYQLAMSGNQVLATTHNPAIAGLVPIANVRHVAKHNGRMVVETNDDTVWAKIANELGVLPDSRIKAFACLEGSNDINCLTHLSRTLHEADNTVPSIADHGAVATIPLGGSTLQQWVDNHYLRPLNKPEAHLYDRDIDIPPKYEAAANAVNVRGGGSFAVITAKRELENYLHPDAISAVMGVVVTFGDNDDVPALVAEAIHVASGSPTAWPNLPADRREEKVRRAKRRMNDDVAKAMTVQQIRQQDPQGEIEGWLRRLGALLQ